MSVSAELLCSFELLKPLDSSALKSHIKRGRNMRNNLLNSPVSRYSPGSSSPMLMLHSLLHRRRKAFNALAGELPLELFGMLSTHIHP